MDKTKIVHFRNKRTVRTNSQFYMNGVVIEIVNRYKYLGIILQENLDFSRYSYLLVEHLVKLSLSLSHIKMLVLKHIVNYIIQEYCLYWNIVLVFGDTKALTVVMKFNIEQLGIIWVCTKRLHCWN